MQELIAKSIESSDLNFSRYGDTFFEASFLNAWVLFVVFFPFVFFRLICNDSLVVSVDV